MHRERHDGERSAIAWHTLIDAWPPFVDAVPPALTALDWTAPSARWRTTSATWRATTLGPVTRLEAPLADPGLVLEVTFEDDHAVSITLDGRAAPRDRWPFDAVFARALGASLDDAVDEGLFRVTRGGTVVTIDLLERRVTLEPIEVDA
jgi:hypothetical protein